jgi:hypothetical protein
MGFFKRNNPTKGRQPGGNTTTTAPPTPPQQNRLDPNTGPLPATANANGNKAGLQKVDGGVNLVNYSPEEMMQQVEQTLSHVHFGMNKRQAFKEWAGEVWDIAAPLVLLAGTAGEVFFFIWNNTAESTAWWVAHKTMQEQADTMNRLGQGMLRAIFDPEMPDDQRQKMLQSLEMLVNMSKMLPPPTEGRIERIEEED